MGEVNRSDEFIFEVQEIASCVLRETSLRVGLKECASRDR